MAEIEPRTPFPRGLRPHFTTNTTDIDQRCVRPASANDTSTTGTHVSFGDPWVCSPCEEAHGCMARFTTPHALRMESVPAFRGGRVLPATSTELASSDAPVTALRLPSPGFRLREETPSHRSEEGLRARGRDHPLTTTRDGRRKY